MRNVWLGLGSNIGNREMHIVNAIESLQDILENLAQAPLFETSPRDNTIQPDFLNTVVRGKTDLSPPGLLELTMNIEQKGGRRRAGIPVKGPRTIDVDILLWEKLVATWSLNGHNLIIPHPAMHSRRFVLEPLLNLDPLLTDPVDGVLWQIKREKLLDQSVKLYKSEKFRR